MRRQFKDKFIKLRRNDCTRVYSYIHLVEEHFRFDKIRSFFFVLELVHSVGVIIVITFSIFLKVIDTDYTSVHRRQFARQNSLLQLMLDLRCVMVNPCLVHHYEMAQRIVQVELKTPTSLSKLSHDCVFL